jgi:hypothetical protein
MEIKKNSMIFKDILTRNIKHFNRQNSSKCLNQDLSNCKRRFCHANIVKLKSTRNLPCHAIEYSIVVSFARVYDKKNILSPPSPLLHFYRPISSKDSPEQWSYYHHSLKDAIETKLQLVFIMIKIK